MTTTPAPSAPCERERQRVTHLVLGKPRPQASVPKKPAGIGKSEWKARKAALREAGARLAPGIDEAVALRETWAGKQGTPETLAQAEHVRTRQGSLARLYASGAIDSEQLAAAAEIASVYERIGRDATVKTASLETRIDTSRHGDGFYEALAQVRREVAYTYWRTAILKLGPAAATLDMIVEDVGLTIAARRHGLHNRRAKKLLIAALDLWQDMKRRANGEVDAASLAAAQAGIL